MILGGLRRKGRVLRRGDQQRLHAEAVPALCCWRLHQTLHRIIRDPGGRRALRQEAVERGLFVRARDCQTGACLLEMDRPLGADAAPPRQKSLP